MMDHQAVQARISRPRECFDGVESADTGSLLRLISGFDFTSEDWEKGPTAAAYRQSLETLPVTSREALYEEVLSEIDAHRVQPRSLFAFIILEPHPRLAAKAVRDFLGRRQCELAEEFAGVSELIAVITSPAVANRGAALAGLVLVGDRRINAIARAARGFLSPSDIRNFSRVQTTTIQCCTVEFCLDWLIELTQKYVRSAVDDLACALTLMAAHDEQGLVEDESESDYLVKFNATRVRRFETFENYFEEIMPVLTYLRGFEGFESAVSSVVAAWEAHRDEARQLRENASRSYAATV